MNLLLDVMSPIPEFSVFDENKIIISIKLPQTQEKKLSDTINPSYIKINKVLNLQKNLQSLVVTTGPGSFTAIRVGVSFMLGIHYSKNIKIAGVSSEDLLNFELPKNKEKNIGMFISSANDQQIICYKKVNQNYNYIKIEKNNLNELKNLNDLNILYFNDKPLNLIKNNIKQNNYVIKDNIVKNFSKLNFDNTDVLKPIYISNNKNLN